MTTGRLLAVGLVLAAAACGDDDKPAPPCSVEAQTGCDAGLVCETVTNGETECFAPVVVTGRVLDASDLDVGVEGARVVALDVNGAVASRDVAISDADGHYSLNFPAVRAEDGTPTLGVFSLRADAAGYATFPSGLRVALPVDVAAPTDEGDDGYVIDNGTTDVALDPLPGDDSYGSISGTVTPDGAGGTLVVADGRSGIAAPDGSFEVFNVSAGSHEVRGYKQGLQLTPVDADVTANEETSGVDLDAADGALATVSGTVSFVNAGSQITTVVLVVKSTFNTTLTRGETPFGLRASDVGGPWEISGVPVGDYVVLAAFENDDLVRDPDASIGGTSIQEITVANAAVDVDSFKITGALEVLSPGVDGPEVVTGTPTFEWVDDSSEDGYELTVYNTFGEIVWSDMNVARVTGGDVTVPYAGPALTPGYYQFRVLSWRDKQGGRTYISATEDLRGVFIIR